MTPEPSEPTLTKFLILEQIDAAPVDVEDGSQTDPVKVWHPLGEQLARDRDQALKLFLGSPVREIEGTYAAVSENAWKPRTVEIKPSIKLGDA